LSLSTIQPPPLSPPSPYTTLFRSLSLRARGLGRLGCVLRVRVALPQREVAEHEAQPPPQASLDLIDDRIGTPAVGALEIAVFDRSEEPRLNSSHVAISYAVFCL